MRASPFLLAALLCPVWMGPSCGVRTRLEENLSTNAAVQREEFGSLLDRLQQESGKPISWTEAYQRMQADGLPLRQSRQQLKDAERQTRRLWLNLVPKVASYANIGTSISELTDLDNDSLNLRLYTNFNIPNPVQFYGSLYGAALQRQNSEWSHELDKRRAFAQLYSAFIEARAIEEAQAALEKRREDLPDAGAEDISKLLKMAAAEANSMERRRQYHRININRLLNTPGENWRLVGKIPVISYQGRLRKMSIGEDFGKLALNLQAVQIEGALLQIQRVKFQQWPVVNFGVGLPPVYSSDENSGFSSDDLFLFSGASKSMDLTDLGGREMVRDAETRLKFTREQVRLRAESEASRVLQLVASYEMLLGERKRLEREIRRLGHPGSTEPEIVLKDLGLRTELEMQMIDASRQLEQLDLQFLIWDETFWNS